MPEITREIALRVLETIDAGLSKGLGRASPGQMCIEAAVCFALGESHSDSPSCVAESVRQCKLIFNDNFVGSPEERARALRKLGLLQLGTRGTLDEVAFAKRFAERTIREILPSVLRTVGLNKEADACEREGTAAWAAGEAREAARATAARAAREAREAAKAAAKAASEAEWAAARATAARAVREAEVTAAWAAGEAAWAAARAGWAAAWAAGEAREAARATAKAASSSILQSISIVESILIEMNVPGVAWLDLLDSPR